MNKEDITKNCRVLLDAYSSGVLCDLSMPEDAHPVFDTDENRLVYFTLPMALNYQRDSYKMWEAVLETYLDEETRFVFDIAWVSVVEENEIRKALVKYKLALQPNRHIDTWVRLAKSFEKWGSISGFFKAHNNDYLAIKNTIQIKDKKGFPYLSGPKIFNYWSYIISSYGGVDLKNRDCIEIAPDTHIIQSSVKLGVISLAESRKLTRDQISARWRELLRSSGINPIDMHAPLWFWSRNGFIYELD